MDQTRGIDRTKPIGDQVIFGVLDRIYAVEYEPLGGRLQVHKKAFAAIYSLMSDHFYKHPEELKAYVED